MRTIRRLIVSEMSYIGSTTRDNKKMSIKTMREE